MRSILALMAVAAMAVPGLAFAQEDMAPCTGTPAPLAEFSPWTSKANLTTAGAASDLTKAEITPGQAIVATLHPTREVAYVTQPEKPGGAVAKGGMLSLKIDRAGTYRVALSAAPWIDILQDGKPLISTAHGGGPACSGIRKVVDFSLQPGRYVVQLSASATEQVSLLVAARP